jgi:hypothetical protein
MRVRKHWLRAIALLASVALIALAYRPAKQFHRFFLTACAADGPARETELDIDPQAVDLQKFYAELRTTANALTVHEIAYAEYGGEQWPLLLFSASKPSAEKSILVVAGIHGNEVSGSLAALRALSTPAPESVVLHVLAPANPVGLKHGSRYNELGCDINRDFKAYLTIEAQAIRSAVELVRPTIVLSLHEGPQDGIFVIGTQSTPQSLLRAITTALAAKNFPLAQKNNLGLSLETPGTMIEGAFISRAKSWLGIYSLGEYTTSLGIPLITTEAPWTLPSMADRIQMQQVVLETLISELAETSL